MLHLLHLLHRNHLAQIARWIATASACMLLFMLAAAVPARTAQAQDACSSANFSVSPCVDAETHVSSGGTAELTVYNYAYGEDAYYARPQCSGIVVSCSGGGYSYVDANSVATVNINFSVNQQSGTGTVGADITGNQFGGEVDVRENVYGQPLLTIDSAQTPVTTGDQNVGRCAVSCFTATTSFSTVPFYTLDQARSLTLVYNEDRAHPRPFIYATVSPAADGPRVDRYYLSATLDGSAVTFTNGEQTLAFLSSGNDPARLGGQIVLRPGDPAVYALAVSVRVQYTDGTTSTIGYQSVLAVYDARNSRIARGWTIAGIDKLDCWWSQGCLTYAGEGSVTLFRGEFPSYVGADKSTLRYDDATTQYVRRYVDGHTSYYDDQGFLRAVADIHGLRTTIAYDADGRVIRVFDPLRNSGSGVPYYQLDYGTYGLSAIREVGGPGAGRVTTFNVGNDRNLYTITDPDGRATNYGWYFDTNPDGRLGMVRDRRYNPTWFQYDAFGKLAGVTGPPVDVDAGSGATTTATQSVYYTAWQGVGVPTAPTVSSPPYATRAGDVVGTVQEPGGRTTQFSPNGWGQPVTTYDPNGRRTGVAYSGKNAVSVTHDDWSQDTLAYDGLDRVTMSRAAGDSATYYYYNAASQIDSVRGQNAVATDYHYNSDNTVASVNDASGVSVTYSYNDVKQVTAATDNAGHRTLYGYDGLFLNRDTLVTSVGTATTVTMDSYGRSSTTNAPLVAAQTVTYDFMNRPQQIIQTGRPATVLTYDPLFRTDVQDANGNVTHTDYNALGWPTAMRDASGATESYRYDIAGRLTSWTNRRGDVMTYAYDVNDRLTSRSGRNVDDSYSYSNDGSVTVGWNSVERDSIFHTSVAGNRLGADSTVTWVNGVRYRVLRGHMGALGMDASTIISSTSVVDFRSRYTSVGANGLVTQVRDGFNTAYLGYNGEALPSSLYNPAFGTRTTHNMLHVPVALSFDQPNLLYAFRRYYHYDRLGRIDALIVPDAPTEKVFQYDQYGQLAGVNKRGDCYLDSVDSTSGSVEVCPTNLGTVNYSYDAVGNRTDLGATYYAGNRLAYFRI